MRVLSRNSLNKTFLNMLIIGAGFIWVVGAAAEAPLGILGDVTVQNDASNPVPVTIQGGGANGASNPVPVRDVDHPARAPFRDSCSIEIVAGESSGRCSFDTVELGKRLVVEFISGNIRTPANQPTIVATGIDHPNGFFIQGRLVHTLQMKENSGNEIYVVSQLVRMYVNEENNLFVRVSVAPDTATDTIGARFFINGHLISVEE